MNGILNTGAVSTVINHGLEEFNAGSQTAMYGFLIATGTYYCVKACKDICDGNIKGGIIKGILGAVALSVGIYNLNSIWQAVIKDANVTHCRYWINSGNIPQLTQECTAYGCEAPISNGPSEAMKYDCPLLESGVGKNG